MTINARVFHLLFFKTVIIWSLILRTSCYGNDDMVTDVHCLLSIKQSVEDPLNSLNTWVFNNITEGAVCKYSGVDCWNSVENKVINIWLSDMGLKGQFPLGIKKCKFLTSLDLSYNDFSGPIPSDIGKIIPYITNLDLSFNRFSSNIPDDFANCTYLGVLHLQNNQFDGQIPQQLGLLDRLKRLNFSNNFLSGPAPNFVNDIFVTRDSYANNRALCGGPLESCPENVSEVNEFLKKSEFVVGFVVGWAISVVSVIASFRFYRDKRQGKNMKLTMPMTKALMIRRGNKKKEEFPIVEHGGRVNNHGDENTRDEIIEEMDS